MMQPSTAQMRRVPSVSSLRREDFSWSMGTSHAPMAGVAVLRRFSCLLRRTDKPTFSHRPKHTLQGQVGHGVGGLGCAWWLRFDCGRTVEEHNQGL